MWITCEPAWNIDPLTGVPRCSKTPASGRTLGGQYWTPIIARIKKVAEGLYETLQTEISKVQVFYAKQSTRDDVKIRIKNYLWDDKTGLPESFNLDEIEEKTDAVFAHVLMSVRNGSAFQEAR